MAFSKTTDHSVAVRCTGQNGSFTDTQWTFRVFVENRNIHGTQKLPRRGGDSSPSERNILIAKTIYWHSNNIGNFLCNVFR
jgi:hypothetical protein